MNKKTLSLSVVIPVFNEEDYIESCLDALCAQKSDIKEVIVVDNNSSDASIKKVQQYPFVTLLREPRQGVRYARNTGFDIAKGDIIARIDADTVVSQDWASCIQAYFSGHPDIDGVVGSSTYYDFPFSKNNANLKVDRFLRRFIGADKQPLLYGSNMAITKKAWRNIRDSLCMEGEMFEDYDMSIHMEQHNLKVGYEPNMVAGVSARRLHDSPTSFFQNMSLHTKTFKMHGKKNKVATLSRLGYTFSYPFFKLMLALYDPEAQKMSIKNAVRKKRTARPDSSHY